MNGTKTAAPSAARPAPRDAIALLQADHEAVSQLFAEYEKTRSVLDKKALVAEICLVLRVHMQIEEDIFYPAVTEVLKDKLSPPEDTAEHGGVKDLIAQLANAEHDGTMYDAKVKALSEFVRHHVQEEHDEMFPKAKATSLDMVTLGARMAARKHHLLVHAT